MPFHFDDQIFIVSPDDLSISNIPSMFITVNGPWASRPVLNATMALNYFLGEFNSLGYHAFNICLHLLNGVLLYFLVAMTGRHIGRVEEDVAPVALLSSLVFVLHPAHTETVTNIVNRSMLLSTFFYFSGLILFLKVMTSKKRRGLYTSALIVVSLLGMASRENFATFPVMLVLYDIFFISEFDFKKVAKHWRDYTPSFIGIAYLAFLVLNNTYKQNAGPETTGIPPLQYVMTQFDVHWTYLRLLVLPLNQNLDYDYPAAKTLFAFPTMLSFLGYLALWFAALFLARRRYILSFNLLWFLIALLPVSFILTLTGVDLEDVIFEHRLYLPSVSVIVIFVAAIMSHPAAKRVLIPSVIIVAMIFGVASYARNSVWSDGIRLWGDVIAKSPNKLRGYNNLAKSYNNADQADKALEMLLIARKFAPGNPAVYDNMVISYIKLDMPEKALDILQTLLSVDPHNASHHSHAGEAYSKAGIQRKALSHFLEALRLEQIPYNHNKVAETYLALGDIDKAVEQFEASLNLVPDQFEIQSYLGLIYNQKGDTATAIRHLLAALRLSPENPILYRILADLYKNNGDVDTAREHLIKAQAIEEAMGQMTD